MNKLIKFALISLVSTLSLSSYSAQISQAQIQQLKSLPPSQQAALAKQFGVDLNALKSGRQQSTQTQLQSANAVVTPRSNGSEDDSLDNEEEQFDIEEAELKPFGYDVFANAPSTFSPEASIGIPQGYILGVGDQLTIQVYGKENQYHDLVISREGQVVIPNLGPFQIAGLTFSEAKQFLVNQIKERIIGVDAVISLSSLRSMRVFVLGDAYKPGPYTLSSLSSVSHAIFAAGGISDIGSLRNIQVKRSGKLVTTVDFYDLLINGDSSKDILLQSGDVVFVAPKGQTFAIDGEVRRPAIYELSKGETFKDALAMAGGQLPSAYLNKVPVKRYEQQLRSAVTLDLLDANAANMPIKDGDFIHVLEKSEMYQEAVTIIGAATRPGKYQWHEGMKISDLVTDIDSHLFSYTDLNYSLVLREIDKAKNIEIHQFSIAKALTNQTAKENLLLKPRDKVIFFSGVETINEELVSLDNLAFTQKSLRNKEKQIAKAKYLDKQFWEKYGANNKKYADENNTDADDINELFNESIATISGGSADKEIDVSELAMFSRQRLLAPINQKLKHQGTSGQPIQLIEVDGQVKFPGIYPLAVNATVSDAVFAAGGITESAYLERIDITRNVIESNLATKENLHVSLADALVGNENANLKLASKDRLNIHQIPAWSENHVIELRGEFVFPGKYTIRRGETLSDVVNRAGGFTSFAYVNGSVFTRTKLQELEMQNVARLAADLRVEIASKSLTSDSSVSYSEAQSLLADLTKLDPVGRLVIDLQEVMTANEYDILLEGGDVLYVPAWKNSVNVIGQVQVTSSHIFDPALDVDNYINNSGGTKKRADDERIYIVAANGSIRMLEQDNWFSNDDSMNVQPGDTIVVPLDSDYTDNLTLWSTATGILYNTAVAVAAINGI